MTNFGASENRDENRTFPIFLGEERIGLNKGSKSVGVRFIEPDPPEAEERVG